MLLHREFLTSRVARRVFLLFVLSALIPLVAVSMLAYRQVGDLVARQSLGSLQASAKRYGMDVFERLLLLDEYLHALTEQPSGVDQGMPFASVQRRPMPELLEPRLAAHLARGRTAIRLPPVNDGGAVAPRLLKMVDPERPQVGLLVAEVEPGYLWSGESLAHDAAVCVMSGRRPLYCSDPLLARHATALQGGAQHYGQDADYTLLGVWDLFMEGQFGTESWTVVIRQPRVAAFEAMGEFNTVFPIVLVLTLAIVALLSVSQIRRLLTPLEQLISGTRRFAARDLDHRVSVDSEDEFAELASAMNNMADRLQRQFRTLDTLACIDRAILDAPEVESLVEQVLQRVDELVRPDDATVVLLERNAPQCGHLYTLLDNMRVSIERVGLSAQAVSDMQKAGATNLIAMQDAREPDLAAEICLPIEVRKHIVGQLCVGWADDPELPDELLDGLRGFADRLAVGLTSVEREEALFRQAHYDNLTGLPNRQLLKDRLEQEIARSRREGGLTAVLLVDLDRFKNVNDSFGHTMGDQLLIAATERLGSCIREADTVARLGGDEFTLILTRLSDASQAGRIAESIVDSFAEPFVIGGYEHHVGASVGITLAPTDGSTVETLLRNADTAMYRAKELGRGTAAFYEETMNARARQRIELESNLRQALGRNELAIAYQPQLAVASRSIVAAEALLRWTHRSQVSIPPSTFVPIAEETGLIVDIGEWVFESVLAEMSRWQRQRVPLQRVAINVSARQLHQRSFSRMVQSLLAKYRLPPQTIEVEITESMLLDRSPAVTANLEFLRSSGMRLSMDDFGTGYSSLNYLTRVNIDTIKIDRSFIVNLDGIDEHAQVVRAIIAMGHSLKREIVAEGVETEQQYRFLKEAGCDLAQGYLFHPPLTSEALVELLRQPAQRTVALGST